MFARLALTIALCLSLVGCQFLAPIGPIISIGVFWMNREAHKYYNTPMSTMETSVRTVLKDLKMEIKDDYKDGEILHLKVAEDSKFHITVNPVRQNVTKVSILVDTLGNKPYAEMIYRHIDTQPNVEQFCTVEELNTAMDTQQRPEKRLRR
jgi:hypothetical protein